MNRFFAALLLLAATVAVYGQGGAGTDARSAATDNPFAHSSGIPHLTADSVTVEHLRVTGLVWGFLKYYHPAVARGDHNWDHALFRVLPKILASRSRAERDAVLGRWIAELGPVKEGAADRRQAKDVKLEPDLAWIDNSGFSEELGALLRKVKRAERAGSHHYIGLAPGVGNPVFKNEDAYSHLSFPDAGYRLLALFRYWNMIQYYFPYRNLIEEDWKAVLKEFVPRFIGCADEKAYTMALLELIARVRDTHANVWGGNEVLKQHFGLRYAAAELRFVEQRAVVTGFHHGSLGAETGLRVGDVVTAINNRPVEELVREELRRTPASNYPTQLRDIARRLLRTNDSAVVVTVLCAAVVESKTLRTYPPERMDIFRSHRWPDSSFRMVADDIAYIHNGALKKSELPRVSHLWRKVEPTRGLIVDCRNYPSDFPIYHLSYHLLPRRTPFYKKTSGSIHTPGLFTYAPPMTAGGKNKDHYRGKVVILVNETTQSSAEFHAMAYRTHPNAVVMGSTTAGADGNVSRILLPGGVQTMISGIGIYYPDGRETQRVGIVPDIEVKPTIEGIRQGRDEVLEAAIAYIEGS